MSEVTDPRQVEAAYKYVDAFQVGGARNAQNFELLRALGGETDKPVILKRGGFGGETVEEWLSAADYVLLGGNENVILCERGDTHLRPHASLHA